MTGYNYQSTYGPQRLHFRDHAGVVVFAQLFDGD